MKIKPEHKEGWEHVTAEANANALKAIPETDKDMREAFVPITMDDYIQARLDDLGARYTESAQKAKIAWIDPEELQQAQLAYANASPEERDRLRAALKLPAIERTK